MKHTNIFLTIVITVLAAGSAYLGFEYWSVRQELREAKVQLESRQNNDKVIEFARLFVKDVLRADKEVDFETRLKLENAVRDTKDPEIISGWQKFTESTTETDAQNRLKDLLSILVEKIKA